jgi:hypothetical protein
MKQQLIATILIGAISILAAGMTLGPQDRGALKSPNGISFAEFKGYESWQVMAPSKPEDSIKSIMGNATMIKACNDCIPANGKPVPDGAMIVKVDWSTKSNEDSPYPVLVPDKLHYLAFMLKDSKRFPDTNGWGYAQFLWDAESKTFKPFGDSPRFDRTCNACHTAVKTRDYVYTNFAPR